jgi:nitrogen-specific signal transduction histidine kinase
MAQLDGLTLDRIDIALRRLVRAVAERLDPLDSLIDAVIAWENLVEHRDQPTKSVLYGVSALVDDRRWSKSRIDKVYKARSDVVHGEPPPDRTKGKEMASAAIRIGLDAVRAVISEHPDKLEMTSEERVTALGFELPPTG